MARLLALLLCIIPCAIALCPSSSSYSRPGDYTITLPSKRTATLHVPTRYDGVSALPLVLNFHGLGSNPSGQAYYTGFSSKANVENFFVVYPAGLNNSWNAGGCCGDSGTNNVDDVGFIRQLLDELTKNLICVNLKKIYSTGMSNGGFFTYRLACGETGYSLAAVAPVAGLNANYGPNAFPCSLSKPLPIIHFHGTADDVVAYSYVNPTVQYWATKDGCNWNAQTTTYRNNSALCYSLSCPNPTTNNITVCTVTGMGHSWPGASGVTKDIKATDQIWEFFKRFGDDAAPTTASAATAAATTTTTTTGKSVTTTTKTMTTTTTAVASTTGSTLTYVGCFKIASIPGTYASSSASMTVSSCQSTCRALGYNLAALLSGNSCYCPSTVPTSAVKVADSYCSTPCAGNNAQKCGGGLTYGSLWNA